MPFKNEDAYIKTRDGHHVTLMESLVYETKRGERLVVPAGLESDGASVPRIFWRLIPPFGKYYLPALLHDWLYGCTLKTKGFCDRTFLEAMLSVGVGRLTAEVIYLGVKYGGFIAFNKCRKGRK